MKIVKPIKINNKYGGMSLVINRWSSKILLIPANSNYYVVNFAKYSYNFFNLNFRNPFALQNSATALRKQFRDLVPEAEYRRRATLALEGMGFELRAPRKSFKIVTTVVPHILPTVAPELYARGPGRKSDAENIVDFIRRVWGPWIGTLARRDLRRLDKNADAAVASWLFANKPWPDDLPLATRSDRVTAELVNGDLRAAKRLVQNARLRNIL